ncbi:hypothetical protein DSO57_1010648 [Entomophthora muscae]|uniref:Uncharacterized protein n=1 Tax=Entomophthora muscae TaxID=34485 RepID=A0ACC2RXN5_9FUNG|nr:hypothetical protein DSO57_1010648 [Entomophthora muscae]
MPELAIYVSIAHSLVPLTHYSTFSLYYFDFTKMMSYEEVIALAKKNTEEQGLLVAKMRRELDRREAYARKEMEEERIEHQKQKALEAAEEKRNPKPLKISRVKYAEMQAEARAKKDSADPLKAGSTIQEVYPTKTTTQALAPKSHPGRKPFSLEPRAAASFTGKSGVSTYAEAKKTLDARKPAPRSKIAPSAGSLNTKVDITVQRMALTPKKIKSQKETMSKQVAPASPLVPRKKVFPSNRASPPVPRAKAPQPVPKHQVSIAASSKRPLATEGKLSSTGLSGSRFAKYGPLEDEPPLKSVKSSASSRPNRSPAHYPSKLSELSEFKARPKAMPSNRVILPVKSSHTGLERARSDSDRVSTSDRERMHSADPLRHRPSENIASKPSRPINREGRKSRLESSSPRRHSSEARRQPFDTKDDVIDEDYAKKNISSIIGNLFGYDRSKYRDDLSDDDMEVSASRVRAEESRSARLGRLEDEREEALERQRLLRLRQKKGSR